MPKMAKREADCAIIYPKESLARTFGKRIYCHAGQGSVIWGEPSVKIKDHYELARLMSAPLNISERKKRAFCFGCIEPDVNGFTYLGKKRGCFGRGHCYEERKERIASFLERPYHDTVFWWYRAGRVFHFLSDCFYRPDTLKFQYSFFAHMKYKAQLREFMRQALKGNPWKIPAIDRELSSWMAMRHAQYLDHTRGVQDDCYYIYTSVLAVFNWMVDEKLG